MRSYLDVKKEETVRRAFQKWSTKARQTRYRRIMLAERERDNQVKILSRFWDRWRERVLAERLRPLEYNLVLQSQRSLLFRAFGVWRSKTRSLPAIHFSSANTKAKYWKLWREAMPRALQASRAREHDRRNLSGKVLDKWVKTYRTKIAMKAVARARYLRLPSVATKQDSAKPFPSSSKMPALSYMPSIQPRHVAALSISRSDEGPSRGTTRDKRLPPVPQPWTLARRAPAPAISSSEEEPGPDNFIRPQTARNTNLWSDLKHASARPSTAPSR